MTPLGWILGAIAVSIALSLLGALLRAPLDIHHSIKNKDLPELIAGLENFSPSWVYISPRKALNGIAIDFGRRKLCVIGNSQGVADLRVFSNKELRSFEVNLTQRTTLKFSGEPPYHLICSVENISPVLVTVRLIQALMRAAVEDAGADSLSDMRSAPVGADDSPAVRYLLEKGPRPGEFLVATHFKKSHRPSHACAVTDKNLYIAVPGDGGVRTVALDEVSQLQTLSEKDLACPVLIHLKSGEVIDLHDDTPWDLNFIQQFLVVTHSLQTVVEAKGVTSEAVRPRPPAVSSQACPVCGRLVLSVGTRCVRCQRQST